MEFSSLPLAFPFQGKGQIPIVLDSQGSLGVGEHHHQAPFLKKPIFFTPAPTSLNIRWMDASG